jgi:hypothetical protein
MISTLHDFTQKPIPLIEGSDDRIYHRDRNSREFPGWRAESRFIIITVISQSASQTRKNAMTILSKPGARFREATPMLLPYGLLPVAITRWNWEIKYGTPAYWIGLGLLVVVLLFALHKVYREWQEIHDVEEPDSPDDLLRSFREAHALGELDDDEMKRVERRLSPTLASSGPPVKAKAEDGARGSAYLRDQPSGLEPGGQGPDAVSAEDLPA